MKRPAFVGTGRGPLQFQGLRALGGSRKRGGSRARRLASWGGFSAGMPSKPDAEQYRWEPSCRLGGSRDHRHQDPRCTMRRALCTAINSLSSIPLKCTVEAKGGLALKPPWSQPQSKQIPCSYRVKGNQQSLSARPRKTIVSVRSLDYCEASLASGTLKAWSHALTASRSKA